SRSQRKNLIATLPVSLGQGPRVAVRQPTPAYFSMADADFGQAPARALGEDAARTAALAARLRE
ncbi:catalase, partial [Pseudomonas aeruginosa]